MGFDGGLRGACAAACAEFRADLGPRKHLDNAHRRRATFQPFLRPPGCRFPSAILSLTPESQSERAQKCTAKESERASERRSILLNNWSAIPAEPRPSVRSGRKRAGSPLGRAPTSGASHVRPTLGPGQVGAPAVWRLQLPLFLLPLQLAANASLGWQKEQEEKYLRPLGSRTNGPPGRGLETAQKFIN